MKQTVRIIGGAFKGKKLHFPSIPGLRPTPDSVRETVFNWLMHDIRDAHCIDAFAGSGALGLEAYSRGAASVLFLEHHQKAYVQLLKTISLFHSSSLQVKKMDTMDFLRTPSITCDILFLDPPFSEHILPQCLQFLVHTTLLRPGGLLYMEAGEEVPVDSTFFQSIKQKKAGQIRYGLYVRR